MSTGPTPSPVPASGGSADEVTVTPVGDLESTNVQAALVELQGDIDALEAVDTSEDGRLDALESFDIAADLRLDALESADTAFTAADAALDTRLDLLESVADCTTADMTLYVDAAGNDSNPGSLAFPKLTIQAAIDAVPKHIFHAVTINVGVGNFAGAIVDGFTVHPATALTTGYAYLHIQGTMSNVTPATGPGSGNLSAFSAHSGATFGVWTDSTQTWTVNDLVGKMVQVTSGTGSTGTAAAPPVYPIASNTATALSVPGLGTLAAASSGYQIVVPGSVITSPCPTPATSTGNPANVTNPQQGSIVFNANYGTGYVVSKMGFSVGTANTRGIVTSSNRVRALCCRFVGGAGASTGISATITTQPIVPASAQACSFVFNSGVGIPIDYLQTNGAPVTAGASITGVVVSGGSIGYRASNNCNLAQCYFTGQSTVGVNVFGQINGSLVGSRILNSARGIYSAGGVTNGIQPSCLGIQNADISSCSVAGLDVEDSIGGGPYASGLTGTGNAIGVKAAGGSRISLQSDCTITGTIELQVDGTSTTLAAMRAASPKMIVTMAGTAIYESASGAQLLSGANSGDITLASVGSSPAAAGASLSGQVLTLQPASATQPGVVTAGAQTIAGAKTLTGALVGVTGVFVSTGDEACIALDSSAGFRGIAFDQSTVASIASPYIAYNSGSSAMTLASPGDVNISVSSGQAFRLSTTGARLKMSTAGTNDYLVSNGGNSISTPGSFGATQGLNADVGGLTVSSGGSGVFSEGVLLVENALTTLFAPAARPTANNLTLAFGGGRCVGGIANHIANSTSGYKPMLVAVETISPASGSANFATLELNPTINGVSSGKAAALAIASKTNTLTGGTINLIDAGTTTTDYSTGYTQKFSVDTSGNIRTAGNLGVGNSASATIAVGTLANKIEVFDAAGTSLGYIPVYATIT